MKKTILTLMAAFLLASCMDKEEIAPDNLVTYEVACTHCLVEFTDNAFEKKIVVSGKLEYSFENNKLESVYLRITKSATMAPIPMRAVIRQGGAVLEVWDGMIEWDEVYIETELK